MQNQHKRDDICFCIFKGVKISTVRKYVIKWYFEPIHVYVAKCAKVVNHENEVDRWDIHV